MPNAMIEIQAATEPAEDFAQRVVRRIERFGGQLRTAALVTNGDGGPAVLGARQRVARAMIATMPPDSELTLTAERAEAGSSQQLFELAGELCDSAAGRDVGVRVRFDEPRKQSGTLPVMRLSDPGPDDDSAVVES
jgi:hypothetical protein